MDRAYAAIRAGILGGDYQPGERLTEEHLAAQAGVSRTPVREALRRLTEEGLVRVVPNQGAFVSRIDDRGLREIFSLRLLLEPHAAERAATRLAAAALARLRDLARRMEELRAKPGAGRIEAIASNNMEFHRLIVEGADNARLAAIVGSLAEQTVVLSTFTRYGMTDLRRSAAQHLDLVEALRSRDPVWSASVMRAHIAAGLAAINRAEAAESARAAA